jgi:hypothetical protein
MTEAAAPRDILDFLVSEPIRVSVKAAPAAAPPAAAPPAAAPPAAATPAKQQ